ncbi:MAG: tail fiber domain-containing protein [Rhodoferax sp.]
MTAITIADLTNAKLDVDHIAAIATSVELTATDRLGHIKSTVAAAIDSIKSFTDRGAWAAVTVYAVKDLVSSSGSWYVCVAPHTSSAAFATDVASKWRVYQGVLASAIAAPATSAYATFADALEAAAGKHLVINSAVTVASNTTIPDTISVSVIKPGLVTINAGQTLTINGSFEAGAFQIFAGAGAVVFGTPSRARSPSAWFSGSVGAVFNTRRTLLQSPTEVGGPVHAYEDDNTLYFTNPTAANYNAYASFDAQTQITGPAGYDHYVGFQARATYSGSGSIWSRWDQFNSYPNHTGSGSVANLRHFRAENPGGTGPIAFQAAFYCEKLTRATENYGLFSRTPLNVIRTEAGVDSTLRLQGNGQVGGYGFQLTSGADSTAKIWQAANMPILIATNNAAHSMITANGRWKFGTTADLVSASNPLDVVGTNGTVLKISSGLNPCALQWSAATAGDNVFSTFYTEASITQRGSIDFNRAGVATRYNTTSDKTLKTRLGPAPQTKSLEILDSTVLEEYFWNEDATQKPQIGPFAQDLHTTFKGAVSVGGEYEEEIAAVTERRMISPAVEAKAASNLQDANGNPIWPAIEAVAAVYETVIVTPAHTVKKYRPWGVDKTAFTFHLIAGYQAQKSQIAELENMVADLFIRLSALEAGKQCS